MPICGYINKYSLPYEPQTCTTCGRTHRFLYGLFKQFNKTGFWTHNWRASRSLTMVMEPAGLDAWVFLEILKKPYRLASIQLSNRSNAEVEIILTGDLPGASNVRGLLEILKQHITIKDSLDECHALSMHRLPPATDRIGWKRTRLGRLVHRAKDYSRRKPVGNLAAANVFVRELRTFLYQHPRYRFADIIISAPSFRPSRTDDLSSYVGTRLAKSIGKRIERAHRIVDVPSRKRRARSANEEEDIDTQRGTIVVKPRLDGSRCILLDDVYESGGTLRELGRACREAGASEVLGLTPNPPKDGLGDSP